MGNHQRYSKGCRTCVQRRVKCDRRHPECKRCEKAGLSCEGFKEAIFIDAKEQVMKRYSCEPKTCSHSNRDAADNVVTSVIRCRQDLQPMHFSNQVPTSPSPSPFGDEIFVCYTVEKLCKGQLAIMYRDVFPCNPSDPQSHQSLMNQCFMSLAKVFYGIQNRESRVLRDGIRLYGRGLSMLSDVLGKDNGVVTTEIMISVLSLCMTESIMPASKSSWMAHVLGLERLFALRGPLRTEYSTMLDYALLGSCRPLLILGAFFTQKPSLMSEPGWAIATRLPETSSTMSDLSFLTGILAELPSLFLQCNECIRLARTHLYLQAPRVTTIWTRVRQLQLELEAWKEQWSDSHRSEVYETLPITRVNSTQSTDWTTVLYFNSVELAITFTMYHTVVILLTSVPISLLQVDIPGLPFALSSISDSNVGSDVERSVRSICRTIEYYLQFLEASAAPADLYLFFPMHVARRASIQLGHSSLVAWLDDAFEAMKMRYPMGIWANMDFGNRFSGLQEGLFG